MEYRQYVARKRAKFKGICGQVNIPWGTVLAAGDGFLLWNGGQLCAVTSQNAYDYFSQNDDGRGQERGALVDAITARLSKSDRTPWGKVWEDAVCRKYKRPEHDDHWLWNYDFYNATIEDLQHIANLVGAKPAGRRA